jgi:ketosteroid isomerase-like protein
MTDLATLDLRVRRLEDRAELRELVARYGIAIDDRNLESVAAMFTDDAAFRSKDGVMNATGREAIVEQFRGRYAALGATNHFCHDQVLNFHDSDPDRATGLVTSHAEVFRIGKAMITALRYDDVYRRVGGRWCFADRLLSFLYYLPVEEYAEGLGSRLRMRAYGDQRPADYPEALPSWKRYHSGA